MPVLDATDLANIGDVVDARLTAFGIFPANVVQWTGSTPPGMTGYGINADITHQEVLVDANVAQWRGDVPALVDYTRGNSISASIDLALFFTFDTTKVFTDAVGGSVVKEIADHAKLRDGVAHGGGTATFRLGSPTGDALLIDGGAGRAAHFTGDVGLYLDAVSVGLHLHALGAAFEVTGPITTLLAKFFTDDSGNHYADAVAKSVVKEIADNATTVAVANNAITDAAFVVPAVTAPATGILSMIVQLWRRFFFKVVKDKVTNEIKTYAADSTTVVTTQPYTSGTGSDQVSKAV